MSCLSVLRFGPFPDDNNCAQRLRTALLDHFHDEQQQKSSSSDDYNDDDDQILTIANRYFTAQVLLVDEDEDAHESMLSKSCSSTAAATLAEDGVVLVFDAQLSNPKFPTSMSSSFDAMEAVHDRAVVANRAGDLLRLCVGVGDSTSKHAHGLTEKEYEAEYSRRVLWCLDRGYEYVEADLSETDLTTGHDARDKDGFARIVEAIAGTVWSSAVMEQRPKQHTKPSSSSSTQQPQQTSSIGANTDVKQSEANPYEPPDPTQLPPIPSSKKSDKEREEMARQALLLADTEEDETAAAIASNYLDDNNKSPENNADAETIKNRRKELEQERALGALEGTLREANRLRELSQAGALSDDERRKRAGDAALLLMDMMGKAGFGDDDDNDEDDSDEPSDSDNSLVEKEVKTG